MFPTFSTPALWACSRCAPGAVAGALWACGWCALGLRPVHSWACGWCADGGTPTTAQTVTTKTPKSTPSGALDEAGGPLTSPGQLLCLTFQTAFSLTLCAHKSLPLRRQCLLFFRKLKAIQRAQPLPPHICIHPCFPPPFPLQSQLLRAALRLPRGRSSRKPSPPPPASLWHRLSLPQPLSTVSHLETQVNQ